MASAAAAVHWLLTVRLQGRDCAADCRCQALLRIVQLHSPNLYKCTWDTDTSLEGQLSSPEIEKTGQDALPQLFSKANCGSRAYSNRCFRGKSWSNTAKLRRIHIKLLGFRRASLLISCRNKRGFPFTTPEVHIMLCKLQPMFPCFVLPDQHCGKSISPKISWVSK